MIPGCTFDGRISGKIHDALSIPSIEMGLMDSNLMFRHFFLAILRVPFCQTPKTILLVQYPIISPHEIEL